MDAGYSCSTGLSPNGTTENKRQAAVNSARCAVGVGGCDEAVTDNYLARAVHGVHGVALNVALTTVPVSLAVLLMPSPRRRLLATGYSVGAGCHGDIENTPHTTHAKKGTVPLLKGASHDGYVAPSLTTVEGAGSGHFFLAGTRISYTSYYISLPLRR